MSYKLDVTHCLCGRGMWNLRSSFSASHDEFLVISFVADTRILQLSMEDELGEADLPFFDTESQVITFVLLHVPAL